MKHKTPVIYKLDTKGKIRQWQGFADLDSWYSISGLEDGKKVTSNPKIVDVTNEGRSNQRSLQEQAIFEVTAEMNKKLDRGYFLDKSMVGSFDKFKPMLANDYAKINKSLEFPVYTQPKLDGIRCVYMNGKLWTRQGKEIVSCPHIIKALETIDDNIVLDGELYNHNLKDNFNKIASVVRKTKPTSDDINQSSSLIQYHVYDAVFTNSPDMNFLSRFQALNEELDIINADTRVIKVVDTRLVNDYEQLDSKYSTYLEEGYEGQMVRFNGQYENKRSKNLLKRKEFITEEFDVIGLEEGKGNWSGAIKRFFLRNKDNTQFSAGVRGKYEDLAELFSQGDTPDWATLRYFALTPDGVPRFPVVIDYGYGQRED